MSEPGGIYVDGPNDDKRQPIVKVRKRPIVVEASQWDGGPQSSAIIKDWTEGRATGYRDATGRYYLVINTLEGPMNVSPGDWIIKGIQGEFYPCKPDVFAETYDTINDDDRDAPNAYDRIRSYFHSTKWGPNAVVAVPAVDVAWILAQVDDLRRQREQAYMTIRALVHEPVHPNTQEHWMSCEVCSRHFAWVPEDQSGSAA